MSYDDFLGIVAGGRKNVNTAQEIVMPAFGTNKNVMCYLDDIYRVSAGARRRRRRSRAARRNTKKSPTPPRSAEDSCIGAIALKVEMRWQSEQVYRCWRVRPRAARVIVAGNPGRIARAGTRRRRKKASNSSIPNVLRVCADPNNLPFSNEKGEGFENKLAELFAAKLGKKLAYTFYPQATGFVRMTLGSHRCDVIMGYPQGDDMVQNTNPYYQTAYALVTKRGGPLDGVDDAGRPASAG